MIPDTTATIAVIGGVCIAAIAGCFFCFKKCRRSRGLLVAQVIIQVRNS